MHAWVCRCSFVCSRCRARSSRVSWCKSIRVRNRAGHNVFVGEVTISSDAQLLRPGMQGRAKLLVAHRPLFWILFHRAWEHVLLRIG